MGRTLATSTQLVHEFEIKWTPFLRAMRKEDQDAFQDLIAFAHYHAAAISYAKASNPFEPFLLAMLIELMKRVRKLENELYARDMAIDVEDTQWREP